MFFGFVFALFLKFVLKLKPQVFFFLFLFFFPLFLKQKSLLIVKCFIKYRA